MKKRMISFTLAALLCVVLGAGALAQEQVEYTDEIWDVALIWNDAACIRNTYTMNLTGDFTSDVHEGQFEVSSLAHEYVFSDGQAAYEGSIDVYYPSTYKISIDIATAKDGGDMATYWMRTEDGEQVLYRYGEELDIVGDPHQLVLLFSQIGDEKIDVQAVKDGTNKKLSFELSGEALKNVVDAVCHPIMLGGFGEAADWDAITAQVTVVLHYGGTDTADVELESQSLGEALICSMEGVQSAENVEFKVSASVDSLDEQSSVYGDYHLTPDGLGDAVDWTGETPEMVSVVEMMEGSYRPGWEELSGKESAKDAVRAQLSGEAEEQVAEE